MNKRKLIYLSAAAVLCISAASCGDKGSSSGSAPAATASATTGAVTASAPQTTTEAATETETAAETTAPETTAASSEDASEDLLPDAVRLFEALNEADMMQAGSGVEVDENAVKEITIKVNGSDTLSEYFLVTDSRFGSIAQVQQFVTDHFCGELLEKYKGIYEGEGASFKEAGGNLYFTHPGRGSGFEYTASPAISDITADSFTAEVSVNNFGTAERFTLKAVREDDKWKAGSLAVSKKDK